MTVTCASSATTGGADYGYFTLSADASNDIFLGGFMDMSAGGLRDGFIGYATFLCLSGRRRLRYRPA